MLGSRKGRQSSTISRRQVICSLPSGLGMFAWVEDSRIQVGARSFSIRRTCTIHRRQNSMITLLGVVTKTVLASRLVCDAILPIDAANGAMFEAGVRHLYVSITLNGFRQRKLNTQLMHDHRRILLHASRVYIFETIPVTHFGDLSQPRK